LLALGKVERHSGDSAALALARDGQFLASAGLNNTIRRWDLGAGGKEIHAGQGHQAPVSAMTTSPNGKLLASGTSLGEIRIWDADQGIELRKWACPVPGDLVLAFASDNKTLASATGSDAIRLWDATTGQAQQQL